MKVKALQISVEHDGRLYWLSLKPDASGGIVRDEEIILTNAGWRDVDAELERLGIPVDVQMYVPADW